VSLTSRTRSLWRNLARRRTVETDLDDELRGYADLLSEELRARGVGPEAAERAARLQLGGMEQVKERVRDIRTGAGLQMLWYDVKYGVRLLGRAPAFACAAMVSVALGIGANSAMFGLVNAIQLSDLPIRHPEELAAIRLDGPRCCRHTGRNRQVSVPLWREIERHQQAFSGLFAFADTRFNLAPHGEVRYVEGLYVSGDFFPVLGILPALGRPLTRDDDRPGCANAPAVISHALWQSDFGGSPDVLARTIRLRTSEHPIAGVMPPQFLGVEIGRRFEVALPLCASGFGRADHWWLAVMGRLKPGSTVAQAGAQLSALGPRLLQAAVPDNYDAEQAKQFVTLKFSVHPARAGISPLREQYQEPLSLLWAIAGLVLVAACANVASLSLVRSTTREHEFALRRALGASTLRLVRQLLVEGTLVAVAGAAAGVVLAHIAQRGILSLLSTSTDPIVLDLGLDWRVLGFTVLMIGTTTLALALAPALQITRGGQVAGGARSTARRERVAAREILVAVQVAMSVVLVSGALLFSLTARNLLAADRGFGAKDLLFAHVFLTDADHAPETRAKFRRELISRFAGIPGIAGAAYASTPPLGGSAWGTVVSVPSAAGIAKAEAIRNEVSAGYFAVMQMPILAGRDFAGSDTPSSPRVAVINETFAARFFSEGGALGRPFIDADQSYEIVGIVRDSKQYTLREAFRPIAYTAASQAAQPGTTMRFVIRPDIGMTAAMSGVRRVVADSSPSASVRFATLTDVVAGSAQSERLMAGLAGFFGVVAMVVAAVGLYGVVSYTAASRRREIGIRLALGARVSDVLRAVLGRVAVVVGAGLVAGVLLTIPAAAVANSLLYDVRLGDPAVVSLILSIMVGSVLVASWLPARRALGTDPVIALKGE
jgi:predicted permease